jgi:prenyltransferase beta subunit
LSYCAIATLSFLGYLPGANSQKPELASPGTPKFERLVRWLIGMQTTDIYDKGEDQDEVDQSSTRNNPRNNSMPSPETAPHDLIPSQLPDISALGTDDVQWAGFSGRSNKIADTCYCFWVAGTLDVTTSPPLQVLLLFILTTVRFCASYTLLSQLPTVDIFSRRLSISLGDSGRVLTICLVGSPTPPLFSLTSFLTV